MMNAADEPHYEQRVTATSGFAYGVIGADIHVFGDGTPVYVLDNWRDIPEADPAWLRELPSRMLNARFAVVDFTGRRDELAQLHRWRRSRPRLAARWLHGPGGAGKTRLAAQFAAESAETGWKVIIATHGPGTVLRPPGSQDLRLDSAAGVLLIVDYADQWPHSHLTWLFSNALLHQVEVPARILLLGRTAHAWPSLRGALANHQADTSTQVVPPLPDGDEHRPEMFAAARDCFARRYQIGDPAAVQPPQTLDAPDMGLTLALHMAALVAVDAHVTGRRPPKDMAGLIIYLLDREQQHWAKLYGDPSHNLDPQPGYLTLPCVMNQAVFIAALTGAVSRQAGATLLTRVQLPADPQQVLTDHAVCYPPAAPGSVLEPLYPDRLAEDFLALTMPGHPADYPAQLWAADTSSTLLAHAATDSAHRQAWAGHQARPITLLAAATQRWPHVGERHLYPLLRQHPELAIDAGSAALSALADIRDIDIAVLEAIESQLPTHRHVDLDVGIADISGALTGHRLAGTTDPTERAFLYDTYAERLANAGRLEDALTAVEAAAQLHQRLAGRWWALGKRREISAMHRVLLAASLNTAGQLLMDLGRPDEALALTRRSVQIWQRTLASCAPSDAEVPASRLAASLDNLGNQLWKLGRREEALAAAEEATRLSRQLARANPAAFEPNLAVTLNNFGIRLWSLGHHMPALAVSEEAVALSRRQAATNRAAFEHNLAEALNNLGIRLWNLGRHDDGLAVATEAVKIYRRLAAINPAAFEPNLAAALNGLGIRLSNTARLAEAVDATRESVDIRRRLEKANPTAYKADLASSLNNLGLRLTELAEVEPSADTLKESLDISSEAVDIRSQLVRTNPAAFEPALAESLAAFASIRVARGAELGKALTAAKQSVDVYQRLASRQPAAYTQRLLAARRVADSVGH
jgi:tetratricopeptide (TPR) repeat protein